MEDAGFGMTNGPVAIGGERCRSPATALTVYSVRCSLLCRIDNVVMVVGMIIYCINVYGKSFSIGFVYWINNTLVRGQAGLCRAYSVHPQE